MRYAESHKDETHKALIAVAAAQLRAQGPDRLSVAGVMKAAGLTHGGFYAHFKSKDALVDETLAEIFAKAKRRMGRLLDGLPPKHALATYVDFYLGTAHRDDASNGCPITALNSDMPRQTKKIRAKFEAGMKALVAALATKAQHGTEIGSIDLAVLACLAPAQAAGAWLGAALAQRVAGEHLSRLLAVTLLATGCTMLRSSIV